jgi:flagellar protein FliO/FliZ
LSLDLYTRFVVALAAIAALLVAFAWLVRRYGVGGRPATAGKRRLAIVEVAPIDGKRRLVLLRRDSTEHLVLLGPESALLVESGIAAPSRAEPSFATPVEGPQP